MTLPRAGSAEGNVEGTHAGLHTLYELDLDERQTLRDVKVCLWRTDLYTRAVLMCFAWVPCVSV
jgi:hypothetical protein